MIKYTFFKNLDHAISNMEKFVQNLKNKLKVSFSYDEKKHFFVVKLVYYTALCHRLSEKLKIIKI